MTNEEVVEACEKFNAYLVANGVKVKGHMLHYDDMVCGTMERDVLIGALISMAAEARGYKVVPK